MTDIITPEIVEAAARGIAGADKAANPDMYWSQYPEPLQNDYRRKAKDALLAALPLIRAKIEAARPEITERALQDIRADERRKVAQEYDAMKAEVTRLQAALDAIVTPDPMAFKSDAMALAKARKEPSNGDA